MNEVPVAQSYSHRGRGAIATAFLLGFFLFLARAAAADDVMTVLRDARAAEAQCDPVTALRLYQRADQLKPDDPAILHEISKQISDSIDGAADDTARVKLAREALDYSQRAAQLAPKDPVNVLSLAICYGRLANLGDNRSRVEATRQVENYAKAALALDPNYAWAHHVLGEWHLQVSHVNGALRAVAGLFYGGLPAASAAEGIAELRRACELEPASAAHALALGLAYWKTGDNAAAKNWLRRGLDLPTREIQDAKLKAQARDAQEKLK